MCVGMSSGQYEIFRDDYDRHNVLQWLCNSCKEQNKETNQSEMPITWGKMKDLTLLGLREPLKWLKVFLL